MNTVYSLIYFVIIIFIFYFQFCGLFLSSYKEIIDSIGLKVVKTIPKAVLAADKSKHMLCGMTIVGCDNL